MRLRRILRMTRKLGGEFERPESKWRLTMIIGLTGILHEDYGFSLKTARRMAIRILNFVFCMRPYAEE